MKLSVFAAALTLSPVALAWQALLYSSPDDQICSSTPVLTLEDLAPGNCTLIKNLPINSIAWLPNVGKGPFEGTYELDFYPSMEECEGDYNCDNLYGIYDTDDYNCFNAETWSPTLSVYKVWKR